MFSALAVVVVVLDADVPMELADANVVLAEANDADDAEGNSVFRFLPAREDGFAVPLGAEMRRDT